jgi:hypothetical protein
MENWLRLLPRPALQATTTRCCCGTRAAARRPCCAWPARTARTTCIAWTGANTGETFWSRVGGGGRLLLVAAFSKCVLPCFAMHRPSEALCTCPSARKRTCLCQRFCARLHRLYRQKAELTCGWRQAAPVGQRAQHGMHPVARSAPKHPVCPAACQAPAYPPVPPGGHKEQIYCGSLLRVAWHFRTPPDAPQPW